MGFRAYDNVKIEEIEVYVAYGAGDINNEYHRTDFGSPVRFIRDIESMDFEPISTENIDTLEYLQLLHTLRIAEIEAELTDQFPQFNVKANGLRALLLGAINF